MLLLQSVGDCGEVLLGLFQRDAGLETVADEERAGITSAPRRVEFLRNPDVAVNEDASARRPRHHADNGVRHPVEEDARASNIRAPREPLTPIPIGEDCDAGGAVLTVFRSKPSSECW